MMNEGTKPREKKSLSATTTTTEPEVQLSLSLGLEIGRKVWVEEIKIKSKEEIIDL